MLGVGSHIYCIQKPAPAFAGSVMASTLLLQRFKSHGTLHLKRLNSSFCCSMDSLLRIFQSLESAPSTSHPVLNPQGATP
ncbi:hypothetical protein EMIT0P2_10140 [Pseudomonas sp. IT-P2]